MNYQLDEVKITEKAKINTIQKLVLPHSNKMQLDLKYKSGQTKAKGNLYRKTVIHTANK